MNWWMDEWVSEWSGYSLLGLSIWQILGEPPNPAALVMVVLLTHSVHDRNLEKKLLFQNKKESHIMELNKG